MLVDSHAFLWLLYNSNKIGSQARQLVESKKCYLSVVSLWELAIKYKSGKLAYTPSELINGFVALNLVILTLKEDHIEDYAKVVLDHKDPFDLMLLGQAKSEGLPLLTADQRLLDSAYETINARQ